MSEAERRAMAAELTSVIARLKGCASRAGVVSHHAFTLEADRLGLTTDEQRRGLRSGLSSFGIHVQPSGPDGAQHHTAPVSGGEQRPATRTPVPAPATAATAPRVGAGEVDGPLAQARSMLARYADADGVVSGLARAGVIRLHGLGPAEARALDAHFTVARPVPPRVPDATAEPPEAGPLASAPAQASTAVRTRTPAEGTRVAARAPAGEAAPDDAVRAARDVLEADRWRRNAATVMLKADEEVGLAILLRGGIGPLDRDVPEDELAALPRDSERWRAYECFAAHNQRLVWKIAQEHQGRGLDIEDLVQHGNIGLLRAIRKFDATMGTKFSTYAINWIRQHAGRAVANEGTLIRIPVHMHDKVIKVAAAERRLLGEDRPRSVENVAYLSDLTFAEVEKVRRISRPTDSLDRIIGDDTALGDLIIGPCRLPGPEAVALRKEFHARLRHVLERHFTERERHILVRRMGLDGAVPDTLEDIGAVFGVTRERIRQVEKKARAQLHDQLVRHGLIAPEPAGHDGVTAAPSDVRP